jgi:hypothetical protein
MIIMMRCTAMTILMKNEGERGVTTPLEPLNSILKIKLLKFKKVLYTPFLFNVRGFKGAQCAPFFKCYAQ